MTRTVLVRLVLILMVAMVVPRFGEASSITSSFLTSSTGTSTIGISDTIQFEVIVTTDAGQNYESMSFSVTGDIAGASGSSSPSWPGVSNMVVAWEWRFASSGAPGVNFSLGSNHVPTIPEATPPPDRVTGPYSISGFSDIGTGVPSLVGTVTIHADASGSFQGGAMQLPGIDGFLGSGGADTVSVNAASFTVVPEPSTAVLIAMGMATIAVVRRRVY